MLLSVFLYELKTYSKRKIQKLIKLQEYKANGINILGLYLKSKSKNIIKPKKELISPLILPLVTLVLILFTIGLNLIFGFRANKTMEYFAVLIYPIIISFHFALIPFLNKIIIKTIKKIKQPKLSA